MFHRKYVLIVALLVVAFALAGFYMQMDVYGTAVEQVSDRAKSFIKEKEKIEDNIGETFISNCFNIKTPYNITDIKFEELNSKCLFTAKMVNPIGYIIISTEPIDTNNNIQNNTGIQLRKREHQLYLEEKIAENIIKFSNNEERNVIYFIYTKEKLLTVSFTDLIQADKIKNEDVKIIIDSII